jgi:hypothetical protein
MSNIKNDDYDWRENWDGVKRNESGEKSGEYDEKVKEKKRANSIGW